MTGVSIHDKECWMCGKSGLSNMTVHHAIPQHLKPKKNVTIPICRKCHDKIHFDDVSGMYAYLHKIERVFNEGKRGLGTLQGMLTKNTQHKEALVKLKKGEKVTLGGK